MNLTFDFVEIYQFSDQLSRAFYHCFFLFVFVQYLHFCIILFVIQFKKVQSCGQHSNMDSSAATKSNAKEPVQSINKHSTEAAIRQVIFV